MVQEVALADPPTAPTAALPLVDKLAAYLTLSPEEFEFLAELHEPRRKLARHRDIIIAGRRYDQLFILCSGVVSRYKVLPDGKRQILNLGLPGDLIGLPSSLFDAAVNSVSAVTEVTFSPVPFTKLFALFSRFPRVATALFWSSASEAAMFGEHLVNLGRRSAYQRLAHLILELLVRLRAAGLGDDRSYTLPLTQELMADVLGLSGPHINRMIRSLRDEGLATIEGQRVVIHDVAALSALAGFDERYLARRPIPGLL
ncbi:MAG TPA: Crp/Fnr family transcriptional regulator [Acetobacteraceae bacterium]|nr:Crp/Fnr family transcriptional regulator [Acetobacteraceae bacterium]